MGGVSDHYLDIDAVMDLQEIISSLQDLEDDTFERHGLTASATWDEVDDPVLIGPEGDCLAYVPYGQEQLLVYDIDPTLATGLIARRFDPAFYPAS